MASNRKTLSELMNEQGLNYTLRQQRFSDYQGHPWTKMYGDIVPASKLESPELKNLNYFANNFGLDTDVASLQSKFDKLTKQEYAKKNEEYLQSENEYYKNMAAQNAQYQQGVQNAMSQALAAGSSRGMQFANQFAAQNELAEQNSNGALELATQRNNLKADEAMAYTQNAIDAEQTAYDRRANIMQNAIAQNANDVQKYAADATLESNNNALRINNYQYNMTNELNRYLEDQRSDDAWREAQLTGMLNLYKTNLEDEQEYARLASNEKIQQMMMANNERVARINASNRNASNRNATEELTQEQMVQMYLKATPAERAAMLQANPNFAAFINGQNEYKAKLAKDAKKSGKAIDYESIAGNTRWMLPDGTTLSAKDYIKYIEEQAKVGQTASLYFTPEAAAKFEQNKKNLSWWWQSPAQNLNIRK